MNSKYVARLYMRCAEKGGLAWPLPAATAVSTLRLCYLVLFVVGLAAKAGGSAPPAVITWGRANHFIKV